MAGLLARLFGGQTRPPDPDPLPGVGGYALPPGPYGATGMPGSTGAAPRLYPQTVDAAMLPSRRGTGVRGTQTTRVSYRGDTRPTGQPGSSPYAAPLVTTPRSGIVEALRQSPSEFFGGPMLKTRLGVNDTAGGELTRRAANAARSPANDPRDTTTLWKDAQPNIGQGTPGSANVRNQIAQRFKNRPGDMHTYQSAPRADQANANSDVPGWENGGAGNPGNASQGVTVPSRFVFAGGGNQTWSVQRQAPYPDPGRGAHLNGQRYYGTGGYDNFGNAGSGQYGVGRIRSRRPVSFTEPAPWSANYYDTTADVGTFDQPGTASQSPSAVYVAPASSRARDTARIRGY